MRYISKENINLNLSRKNKKCDNGKILVIGGSTDYTGAPYFAGIAALITGCDWVTIAAPEKTAWVINSYSPDLVVKKIKGTKFTIKNIPTIKKLIDSHDIIIIGNGIGQKSNKFIQNIIYSTKKPMVIDADAIKCIDLKKVKNSILTPHQFEYDMLLKNSKITEKHLIQNIQNNIILKKGKIDKIISKETTQHNKTGNPGMTKAGTGDILAGIIGGLLAQKVSLINASSYGSYINGRCGDKLLSKHKGYFFIASDIISILPEVLKECLMKKS